jgi:hypothetical protein
MYKSRLTKEIAVAMLNWIKIICSLGWKPFCLRTYIVGGVAYKFNKIARTDSMKTICEQYREYQNKLNKQHELAAEEAVATNMQKPVRKFAPGRDTLRRFLKYVTERTRSKACLSTYFVRFIEAFAMYARLIAQCRRDHEDALQLYDQEHQCPQQQKLIRERLVPLQEYVDKQKEYKAILNFAKYELTNHLQLTHEGCSGVGLHCIFTGRLWL